MKKLITFLFIVFSFQSAFSQLPPAKPTGVSAAQVALSNSIAVNWTSSTGSPIGYKVYYRKPGTTTRYDSVRVGLVNTRTLTGLTFNDQYKIYLRAFRLNTAGTDTLYSAKSDSITVTVVGLTAPQVFSEPATNTSTTAFYKITDTNQLETGFEVEIVAPNGITTITNQGSVSTSTIFSQNNLLPKTTYTIRVRAKYNTFAGPWSAPAYMTTLKDAPPAPSLSESNNCPTFVGLAWTIATRSEDVEYFIVQRSFDNNTWETIAPTYDPIKRDYFDNGPVPGKTIYYRVVSANISGSTASNIISVTVKNYVAPNPVANILSDATLKTNSTLVFKWTNGAIDAVCNTNKRDEIIVFLKNAATGNYDIFKRLTPFETSVTITGLSPKQLVEIEIGTVSDKGILSPKIRASDKTAGPPDAPSNMFFVSYVNATGVTAHTLEWKDNSADEDYFVLERGFTTSTFMKMAVLKANLNKFDDLNTEEGVIYYYRVKGGSVKEGEGAYSNIVGPVITEYTKPSHTPWGLRAKQNGLKVDLKWVDDSMREESYIIEKSQDEGASFSIVATLQRNFTMYTDENVTAGKTYLYRIKAENTKGSSPWSKLERITLTGSASTNNTYNIYPNPFVQNFTISKVEDFASFGEELNLKIYNSSNNVILQTKVKINLEGDINVVAPGLQQGIYTIVLENGTKKSSKRVLKL